MSNHRIGETVRKLRTQLEITQEDLCDGVCSVPTLSRIENGQRLPNKATFDALMQRMGRTGDMYDALMSDRDFAIHEKKYEIKLGIVARDYDRVADLLEEYKELIKDSRENLYFQFSLFADASLKYGKDKDPKGALDILTKAIKISLPDYGKKKLAEFYLNFDEIIILNDIAAMYGTMGERDKSIPIYSQLDEYMSTHDIDTHEKLHMYPMVLHNYTKELGQTERYIECIDICTKGIELCKQMDNSRMMARFYYNRGWAMYKRGKAEQSEAAKNNIIFAYILSMSVGNERQMKHYENFARTSFHIELAEMFPYVVVNS